MKSALAEDVQDFDLVHIHSLFLFPQFAAYRASRHHAKPYVVSLHGALDPYLRQRGRRRKAVADALWQKKFLERAAALHLTTPEEARLVAHIAPNVPRAVIPLGIHFKDFQDSSLGPSFRERYLDGAVGPIILNIGRLSHKKGLDVLIRAFALVRRTEPESQLVIVGPDDEGLTEQLRGIARDAGVDRHVTFTGMLYGREKLSALAAADVWALPSHTENFGIAVIEALAAGLPTVISPAVNIAPEMERGGAGVVCEATPTAFAQALTQLLSDPVQRESLAVRAREFAQRYDWDSVGRELVRVYESVVAHSLSAPHVRGDTSSSCEAKLGLRQSATKGQTLLSMETSMETQLTPFRDARRAAQLLPVTVVLPVLNEERNLPDALDSVDWADEVIVVDSGSTDGTAHIARAHGAEVINFRYAGQGPKKKAWTLQHISPRHDWVLFLDADERITADLRDEIETILESGVADGYYVDRELIFMGRSLRCFRPNWNLRLFRAGRARMEDLGLDDVPSTGDNEIHEHLTVDGLTDYLRSPLRHNDYRGLTAWLDRHNRYATWEAHLYRKFRREPIGVGPLGFIRLDRFTRKRVLRRLWVRMPLRPLMRFLVWYVLRRGFLDGRPGFTFCVLMSYYEFVIGAKLRELERSITHA